MTTAFIRAWRLRPTAERRGAPNLKWNRRRTRTSGFSDHRTRQRSPGPQARRSLSTARTRPSRCLGLATTRSDRPRCSVIRYVMTTVGSPLHGMRAVSKRVVLKRTVFRRWKCSRVAKTTDGRRWRGGCKRRTWRQRPWNLASRICFWSAPKTLTVCRRLAACPAESHCPTRTTGKTTATIFARTRRTCPSPNPRCLAVTS